MLELLRDFKNSEWFPIVVISMAIYAFVTAEVLWLVSFKP
jgi:hypothetical protein